MTRPSPIAATPSGVVAITHVPTTNLQTHPRFDIPSKPAQEETAMPSLIRCPECGRFNFHRSDCSRRDSGLPTDLFLSAIPDDGSAHDGGHGRFCPDCALVLRWQRLTPEAPIVDEESVIAPTEFEVVDALTLDQWVATIPEEYREAVLTYAEAQWREQQDTDGEVPEDIWLDRPSMIRLLGTEE